MKRFLLTLSALAIGTVAASAADLPAKTYTKAPPAPLPPPCIWCGFYVGGNIGYGWGDGDTFFNPLPTAATFFDLAPTTLSPNPRGVLGGVQVGYNWQTAAWVWGIEADIQGADITGSALQTPIINTLGVPFGVGSTLTASEKIDWFGTVRGRVGFAAGPVLLYATGGLAYADVKYTADSNFLPVGTEIYPAAISSTRFGWTAGGGVEWAFAGPWSAKFEGLYYDLGNASTIANPIPVHPPFQVGYSWKTTGAIARVGINYRFGGPGVAGY